MTDLFLDNSAAVHFNQKIKVVSLLLYERDGRRWPTLCLITAFIKASYTVLSYMLEKRRLSGCRQMKRTPLFYISRIHHFIQNMQM